MSLRYLADMLSKLFRQPESELLKRFLTPVPFELPLLQTDAIFQNFKINRVCADGLVIITAYLVQIGHPNSEIISCKALQLTFG